MLQRLTINGYRALRQQRLSDFAIPCTHTVFGLYLVSKSSGPSSSLKNTLLSWFSLKKLCRGCSVDRCEGGTRTD